MLRAYPAGGAEAEYLLEKGIRIRARPAKTNADFSTEDGLKKIRQLLCNPGQVVQLVGLSRSQARPASFKRCSTSELVMRRWTQRLQFTLI